jgi:hypothetical protein
MRWRVDPKPPRDKTKWHHWFAWHPVRSGPYLYWLCFMDRKGEFHEDSMGGCWTYEYKELVLYY